MSFTERFAERPQESLRYAAFAVLILALTVAPTLLGTYYVRLLTYTLILGCFGVLFNWAFGFADLPAFGHAAFFGLGAYGFALSLSALEDVSGLLLIGVLVGLVLAFVYGVVVGLLSVRGKGIYFALLTFAFAQFAYEFVFRFTDITGGDNGVIVFVPAFLGIEFTQPMTIYYLTLAVLVGSLLLGYQLMRSPYGRVLKAINYNEQRASAVGYPVRRVKISIFVLTATLASVPGMLYAMNNQFISPSILHWQLSVDALIVAIIGGTSTVAGPLVGAFILVGVRQLTSGLANIGIMLIGITFIVVIVLLPEGVLGYLRERLE